jgi:uncharacterized protein YhaN
MRLLKLDLMKYGPFTDTLLNLEGADCIHIVCGPNEAGKSSALRALRALLYGIPTQTTDNFVHENKDLRIGAVLQGDNGPLHVMRKKGNKNTLLDHHGRPLPDDLLDALLNGVDQPQFETMFGLDYKRLVDGGEEILKGRGSLSAALFAAGTGIAGVRALLAQLDEEAGDLFSPSARARNPRINESLAWIKELRNKSKEATLKPEAWESEIKKRDQAREQIDRLRAQAADLEASVEALKQLQAALPRLSDWDHVAQALAALDDAVLLRQDFTAQRVEIDRELTKASERTELAQRAIRELKEQIESIQVPQPLLAQSALIDELYQQLGAITGARRDLPEREGELHRATEAARRHLHTIDPTLDLPKAERFRLSDTQRLRVSDLGNDRKALVNAKAAAADCVEKLTRQIEEIQTRLAQESECRDSADLHASVQAVQKAGDIEKRLQAARRELARLSDEAATRLRALPLWQGTLEELEALAVPPLETVSRFTSLFNQLDQERTASQNELARIDEVIRNQQGAITELQHGGPVPCEDDVDAARTQRDEGWRLVRRAWLDAQDVTAEAQALVDKLAHGGQLPEAYEESVRVADHTVDRLRGETDRVVKSARLQADLDESQHRREGIRATLRELAAAQAGAEKDWCEAWAATGIKPLPPAEMREWMAGRVSLLTSAAAIRERRAEVADFEAQVSQFHELLNARLRELGEKEAPADQPLDAMVMQCDSLAKDLEGLARAEAQLRKDLARDKRELEQAEKTATTAAHKLNAWQSQWAEALQPLGLPADASPNQANARLETIKGLFDELKNADEANRRIRQMRLYLDGFESKVRGLAGQVATDLLQIPSDQAVGEVHRRCQQAGEQQRKLEDLQKELAKQCETLRKAEIAIQVRRQELEKLCQEAHCSDPRDLPEAERRADEKRHLLDKCETLRTSLQTHAGREGFDTFLATLREAQPAELTRQIGEAQEKLQDVNKDAEQRRDEIAAANAELRNMDGSSAAADFLQEAHGIAARIQPDVEHYARICFAAAILRQAIEQYRRENQDPVLKRAGELFSLLTVHSFAGLEADVDDRDQPVLLGVRPNGKRLTVDAMSTGARDQLYLALRLASLERCVEKGHAMPFIVDDVIVNFDDRRAEATLEVLTGLASKTQIIFFTHHEHLVALAPEPAYTDGLLGCCG